MTFGRATAALSACVAYAVLTAFAIFALTPLVLMVATAFKPSVEIFQIPPRLLPDQWTLDNFRTVLFDSDIPVYAFNSLVVGGGTTLVALLLGCAAGYGFSRFRFTGSSFLLLAMLVGQLVPLAALIVPFYLLFDGFRLIDTYSALIIGHLTVVLPLVVWMATSYIDTIPRELEEASIMDGATRLGTLWRITLPLALPGTIAIGIFAFLNSWNEFVLASIIGVTNDSRTLPVGLTEFAGMFTTDWGSTMAASVLMTVPVLISFLFFQKYFVKGLAAGAVK